MPRKPFRVNLTDLSFYQETVPCQNACPVRTDARGYVNAIAVGEYERAYLIARETNPFASSCGWVCGAPCEAACRRGKIDETIAIRALKRFVDDHYGVFIGKDIEPPTQSGWPLYGAKPSDINLGNSSIPAALEERRATGRAVKTDGGQIAVVGSGPAGLTCAHDLALLGYDVTIFEASQVAGGMLRLGVPEYRLPRALIDAEIEAIISLGPRIEFEKALGRDFLIADLRREFDAIFLSIGTYGSRMLNIEGEQQDSVLRAVDFLLNVNLGGYNLDLGRKIVVIGGGDVAMDVARTAARLGHEAVSGGDLELALDVARTARRLGTTEEVHCLVIEGPDAMLADPFEIEEAKAEGVEIHNNIAPVRILGENDHATGVETLDVSRVFDDQGRFNPELVAGTEKVWDCDSVIVSIGQVGELEWIRPEDGLETARGGTLKVDSQTMATTAEGIFAGGDIAFGPRLIINAVADGQKAASSLHAYLRGAKPRRVRKGFFKPVDPRVYPSLGPLPNYMRGKLKLPPTISVDRRVGVALIEERYDEQNANEQAARCLICSLNPVFDSDLCILCNGCIDVCPTDCLKLVPASDLEGGEEVQALIQSKGGEGATAMLLDPRHCIRCGLCAARCPTDAVVMHSFQFREELVYKEDS